MKVLHVNTEQMCGLAWCVMCINKCSIRRKMNVYDII